MLCDRTALLSAALCLGVGAPTALGQDNWPQWRGPDQNGVSSATNLPLTWGPEQNIVWRTELPSWSGATPIIWGDRIFVTTPSKPEAGAAEETQPQQRPRRGGRGGRFGGGGGRNPGGNDLLLFCISRTDGDVLWQHKLAEGNQLHRKGNNASPSPVTDGKHVWVVTGTGSVTALTMEGEQIWQQELQEMYGGFGLNWGYASSPLLYDGMLVIEVLHGYRTDDPSYVVAFDAATGEVKWRVERPTDAPFESPDAYTTPIVVEREGAAEIVISGGDYVTGHDPATGKERWRAAGLNPRGAGNYRIVASPVYADGMIYAPTRVRPLLALRTGGEGDVTTSNLVWKWDDTGAPDVPTPVCDGKRFYMVNDSGMVTCLDAKTGAVIWGPERTIRGTVSSSPLLAEGRLYFTNEEGVTIVVSAGDTFEILATNELDGSYTLSSPVPAGNQMFIRTATHLYCIGAAPE